MATTPLDNTSVNDKFRIVSSVTNRAVLTCTKVEKRDDDVYLHLDSARGAQYLAQKSVARGDWRIIRFGTRRSRHVAVVGVTQIA